jgi:hypothetical protein
MALASGATIADFPKQIDGNSARIAEIIFLLKLVGGGGCGRQICLPLARWLKSLDIHTISAPYPYLFISNEQKQGAIRKCVTVVLTNMAVGTYCVLWSKPDYLVGAEFILPPGHNQKGTNRWPVGHRSHCTSYSLSGPRSWQLASHGCCRMVVGNSSQWHTTDSGSVPQQQIYTEYERWIPIYMYMPHWRYIYKSRAREWQVWQERWMIWTDKIPNSEIRKS